MAGVFLEADETFRVVNDGTVLNGEDGDEQVTIDPSVTGLALDANVERIDLAGNAADFTFQQTGNALNVVDANGGEVTKLPLQPDGSEVVFADGSVDVTVDSNGMQLGGETVPSGSAGSVVPSTIDGTVTSESVGGTECGGGGTGTQPVTATDGGTFTADDNTVETFTFAEDNISFQISNFAVGTDVLDFPDVPPPTLINNDFTDGEVTVQWAGSGSVAQAELVGLSSQEDGSLFFPGDLGNSIA